ncbi:hypothetical protein Glove_103g4 [Diversispora epigaea]|uniref:Uncharacterized protein n=1 Tax=Diversispora epigaea TaxID=1348612 RepID=A0A397J5Z2_9GLOM|nr:hypothetical protein Glove_103g4 [Diversispora epigaea]
MLSFIIKFTYEIILLQNKLHGLLQAAQESQNYVSMLNRGVLGRLDNVITSNKHGSEQSEPIDLKRKITESDMPQIKLTAQTAPNKKRWQISGLKSLIFNLEVQYEEIVKEIECHSCDQIKLVSLLGLPVTWLCLVLAHSVGLTFSGIVAAVNSDKKTMTYKVDALTIVKENHKKFVTIEDRPYTLGNTKKTLLEGGEMFQGTLQQYLNASLETAKKLKFYTMQIIVDHIVLIEISVHKSDFKVVEVRSARYPFS